MSEHQLYRVMAYVFAAFGFVVSLQLFVRTVAGYTLTVRAVDTACLAPTRANPFDREGE